LDDRGPARGGVSRWRGLETREGEGLRLGMSAGGTGYLAARTMQQLDLTSLVTYYVDGQTGRGGKGCEGGGGGKFGVDVEGWEVPGNRAGGGQDAHAACAAPHAGGRAVLAHNKDSGVASVVGYYLERDRDKESHASPLRRDAGVEAAGGRVRGGGVARARAPACLDGSGGRLRGSQRHCSKKGLQSRKSVCGGGAAARGQWPPRRRPRGRAAGWYVGSVRSCCCCAGAVPPPEQAMVHAHARTWPAHASTVGGQGRCAIRLVMACCGRRRARRG